MRKINWMGILGVIGFVCGVIATLINCVFGVFRIIALRKVARG